MNFEKSKFLKYSLDKRGIILVKREKHIKKYEHVLIFTLFIVIILLIIIISASINLIFYFFRENFIIIWNSLKSILYFNNNLIHLDYYINEDEKIEALKNGQIFFNLCIEGKLMNEIPKSKDLYKNPLISVVIPVYNTNENIKYVVRSAQNQNISNIEIILVNDFSNDDTYITIEELQKEDKRIRCLNNKKNMGTLYSRCIGTLKAKGKYIFPLDNDDFFFDENLFYIISKEAEKGNFDIVEFRGASREIYDQPPNQFQNTNYSNHQHGLVLYQPELSQYARKRGSFFGVYDCFLWAKCIKTEIYKTTINYLGKKFYSQRIIWGEDLIISFLLFRVAQSFKFIGKYGIFRFLNTSTATYHTPEKMIAFSKIIYLSVILKFTENNILDKKYVSFRAVEFLKSFQRIYLGKKSYRYLIKIVKDILDNEYIDVSDKNKIKSAFDGIIINMYKLN